MNATISFHVLIPDNVDTAAIDLLKATEGFTVETAAGNMPRSQTLQAAAAAHALIVRSSTTVDSELFDTAPQLQVVVRAGVGVDNIDLDAATERGIVVMNTPDGNTISTAEHTIALMLALVRHIPQAHQSLADGRWDRKLYKGLELYQKTLGIVGLGRIGQAVAVRARALGMTIVAFDPYVTQAPEGVELVEEIDTLYQQADFITLHAVITDETCHMIDADALTKMKAGVHIVNTARGALIDEAALAAALDSGQVAGAALDVYSAEPPALDHPLLGRPDVVHTPHLAASTSDAQIAVAAQATRQIVAALQRNEYENVVNPDVLT